ncbi:mitochondrial carrier domain-containing protein [Suillus occidentalis]|nr:mitochondrial carrier domain-containing protein [Suillus occidentalis]
MQKRKAKWTANSMFAGAGGGLVASIATCPLDVIKTKLQAQRTVQGQQGYQGVLDIVKTTLKHDGVRWHVPCPVMRDHPWTLHILSAMIAGAASTTCTNPLWVIKTRFMTQSRREVRYRHTYDAALAIYRTEGIRAFYRGLLPSLLGITHVAVQFPLYEKLKMWAQGDSDAPLRSDTILLCSGIAKMSASIATYPHEVVRTRLQTLRLPIAEDASSDGMVKTHARRGIIYITRKIIQKEGWTGLYKGLSVNLFRTVPNSAVTLLTYELLMRHLTAQQ